jgi:Holliday junction resolvase RusA-like endonuclease
METIVMRVILKYEHGKRLLTAYVHGAPHRRVHREVLKRYREEIWKAAQAAGIKQQIAHNINLSAYFIDPTGPDLDNLVTALFQALDGKCGKGPALLQDDRQIVFLDKVGILFP